MGSQQMVVGLNKCVFTRSGSTLHLLWPFLFLNGKTRGVNCSTAPSAPLKELSLHQVKVEERAKRELKKHLVNQWANAHQVKTETTDRRPQLVAHYQREITQFLLKWQCLRFCSLRAINSSVKASSIPTCCQEAALCSVMGGLEKKVKSKSLEVFKLQVNANSKH